MSLVWIVPIIAVLVGISLVVHNWLQEGPTITITFKTGQGLTANKTQVKYRNVVIGQVTDVQLSEDQKNVTATVKLAKTADTFTHEDSVFWVVRPRIGAGGISGIDTLLSGDFIGADAGQSKVRAKSFTGLENPPPITYGEPGKRFTLHSQDLGSLDIGSPVYLRKIPVGQVVSYALDAEGKGVNIDVFVNAPQRCVCHRKHPVLERQRRGRERRRQWFRGQDRIALGLAAGRHRVSGAGVQPQRRPRQRGQDL
nr:hypothetical protein GCM10020185_03020 [Pseudomonas brassicacearum subsp. brassicacearum]